MTNDYSKLAKDPDVLYPILTEIPEGAIIPETSEPSFTRTHTVFFSCNRNDCISDQMRDWAKMIVKALGEDVCSCSSDFYMLIETATAFQLSVSCITGNLIMRYLLPLFDVPEDFKVTLSIIVRTDDSTHVELFTTWIFKEICNDNNNCNSN